MRMKYNTVRVLVIIYSSFPVFIFFFNWLRFPYSLVFSFCLFCAIFFYYKSFKNSREFVEIKYRTLFIALLLIIIFSILTGVGGYFAQNIDFSWRTAIFRDLVQYDWPVYYPKTDSTMHYYFLFWLPAALIGKVTNFTFAQFALFLYLVCGLFLIYLIIAKHTSTGLSSTVLIIITIFTFGLLEFFSGTIFSYLFKDFTFSYRFIFTGQWLQFVNNQISLSFIYNQTIVPWMMLLLIVTDRKIATFAICGGMAIAFAPFSVFGLLFYAISYVIYDIIYKKRKNLFVLTKCMKELFSPSNLFAVAAIVPVFALYYMGSSKMASQNSTSLFTWTYAGADKTTFIYLIVYYIFAVMCYFVGLYKFEKRNIFYYLTLVLMIILPHIRISSSGLTDFISHASPVITFHIMYMCLKNVLDKRNIFIHKSSYILIIIALSFSTLNYYAELWYGVNDISAAKCINPVSEKIYTLSDKTDEVNFFIHQPDDNKFNIIFGKKYR